MLTCGVACATILLSKHKGEIIMNQDFIILEDLKFNEQRFKGIAAINSLKLYYRPLYSCFQLQFTLGFYINYRRRKEEECIDLNKIIIKYNIKKEDIEKIPLFIELKNKNTNLNVSVEKQFASLVNDDVDYCLDLLLEYEKNIGEYIYNAENKNIFTTFERICGYNDNNKALERIANILNIKPLPSELNFHRFTIDVY